MTSVFENLYKQYINCINILRDICPVDFIPVKIQYSNSINLMSYIEYNFGSYFPLIINGKDSIDDLSSIECEKFNTFNTLLIDVTYVSSPLMFMVPDCVVHNDIKDLKKIIYSSLDIRPYITKDSKDIIRIMSRYEQILRLLIIELKVPLAQNLQKYSDCYPSEIINFNYRKIGASMQFYSLDGKVRHYTALKKYGYDYNIPLFYLTFLRVITVMINYFPYEYMSGLEGYGNKFIEENVTDKTEWWEDNVWSPYNMAKSINNGARLPFIYRINNDGLPILTDGIHRYEALNIINKNGIKLKILALNTHINNRKIYPISIKIPRELYYNTTWEKENISIESEVDKDGYCLVDIHDTDSLIYIFFMMNRELNNFIDDGKLNNIPMSSTINHKKEI